MALNGDSKKVNEFRTSAFRRAFVDLLQDKSILLNNSPAGHMKRARTNALYELQADYEKTFGRHLPIEKLKRKIYTMKRNLRRKVQRNTIRYKARLGLKDWEMAIFSRCCNQEKPEIEETMSEPEMENSNTQSSCCSDTKDQSCEEDPLSEDPLSEECTKPATEPSYGLTGKFENLETEDTKYLSNAELQRLLLLEQLKLTRLQIAREMEQQRPSIPPPNLRPTLPSLVPITKPHTKL